MRQVIITIGDTHLSDNNYGRHKDYANDCRILMGRVADAVENYAKKLDGGKAYRVVLLGDFADTRFSHLEFRIEVENFLKRLSAVCEKLYCLKGNHDEASGSMTELDYYTSRGFIDKHPAEEEVGGKVVRYVDYIRDTEECAEAHEGENVEVIFTHNALAAGENNLFSSVDVSKLDAPKLRVGIMGHIHGEMYFKAHNRHGQDVSILDGGAACIKSANRKDAEGFNLLALHFDKETGKIGSKKIPVKYVEDAFMEVDNGGVEASKWSVDSDTTQIDFSVSGAGSMDIDDLAEQLKTTSSPEVIEAVKMLFAKYGKVTMGEEVTADAEDDDNLLDDITSMFKSNVSTPAVETDFDAAEAGLLEPEPSPTMSVGYQEEVEVETKDAIDDLFDDISESVAVEEDTLETEDDGATDIEELLSDDDKESLRSGVVAHVDIGDGLLVVYKDGMFIFAE